MPTTLTPRRFSARTLPALLVDTAARRGDRVFLRYLPPEDPAASPRDVTFAAFRDGVGRAAAFLQASGVGPGDRVLLLAENTPEWQQVALAAQLLRAEPAALFSSLSAEQAAAIARRVRPRVIWVSGPAQWAKLAPVAEVLGADGLGAVLSLAGAPADLPPGVRGASAADVFAGHAPGLPAEQLAALAAAVREDDPFLLLFTSGTTGRPKGVRLPQRAIVHAIDGGAGSVGTTEDDLGLHFLPFGHVAGHDQFALALGQGHALVMASRREDIERGLRLGPTYLFSVPLVYERMRTGVDAKLASLPGPVRAFARAALDAAARVRVDGRGSAADRLLARAADALVGRSVRARLGGHVKGLFSGGAPASAEVFRFFESLGIPFVELYGMSETAGLISSNLYDGKRRAGSAGLLTPDHEVRFSEDGELLVRGPLLLDGYLEPEDGADAWTEDGFFRTGDLGRLEADGTLRIEGRKKHLLVLSTGKKLSPEPIEQAIAAAEPFQGAVLLGEGRPFVAVAVFVAREELERLAAAGRDAAEALLPRARAALAAFSEYEKPKRLVVIPGAPQDHPALITPTLKLRRDAVLAQIRGAVAEVYGTA